MARQTTNPTPSLPTTVIPDLVLQLYGFGKVRAIEKFLASTVNNSTLRVTKHRILLESYVREKARLIPTFQPTGSDLKIFKFML